MTPFSLARSTIAGETSTAKTRAALALGKCRREPAGAAAELEHAGAAELAEPDERLVDGPPVLVDRTQLLVARGALVESRRGTAHAVAGSASGRSGRAPPRTSAGSPRSRKGTSIRSKSRGSDRRREDRAGLAEELRAEVARRDVRQREQRDARVAGDLGGLDGGRVPRLAGAATVGVGERRLVHEHVCGRKEQHDGRGADGVAGVDDGASRPRRADELRG